MLCEHYKEALIEAAASDAPLPGDLRAHLGDCGACRAAFEEEQALFASIDGGLRVTANAEVPASLLPRVRARLDETEAGPNRPWVTNWLVLASAAVLVGAFFSARAVWRTNVARNPVVTAVKPNVISPEKHEPTVAPPVEQNFGSQRQVAVVSRPSVYKTAIRTESKPEVLVPKDQEVLLMEYAEQWRAHKHPLLLAQGLDATILTPLQVAPIQIAELDVKLLAEEKSQ